MIGRHKLSEDCCERFPSKFPGIEILNLKRKVSMLQIYQVNAPSQKK